MKWILYPLTLISLVNTCFAWGPEGHRIVAQIAQSKLTPKAQSEIKILLNGKGLPEVANWADSIKGQREWAFTKPWHFVDIADGETYEHSHQSPDGDAIKAITQMVEVLKKRSASLLDRQQALMFIVHFVGDIHQPLHVGRPDDQGGNAVKIVFQGQQTNLHALWDGGMIRAQKMSEADYVRYLETLGVKSLSYDIPEFPFSRVVQEDMALRDEIYNFKPLGNAPIRVSENYMRRNISAMNTQLLSGGKRLAQMLNMIFK